MSLVAVALDTHTDLLPAAELAAVVRRIEALGYESVWLPDALSREPFVAATFLLANTTRLKVGTGVANVYGRDPTTAAQTRRSLSEFYPGRFLMGLGCSNAQINALRGAEWIPPARKLHAYLAEMNEIVPASAAPAALAPIHLAAHGPQLQALAAECDGIMTWVMPPAHVELSRRRIGPDKELGAQVPCVLDTDPARARTVGRTYLGLWLALPHYRKSWVDAGFAETDFVDGGSDRLIDAIVAWGDETAIAERVRTFHRAGATRVSLEPIRTARSQEVNPLKGDAFVEADWDALAPIATALGLGR